MKQLLTLTKRLLLQNIQSIDTVITVLITPIFMLLAFVFIFGGSVSTGGATLSATENRDIYLNYALPGFLLIGMSMASAYTAMRICNDNVSGFLNRLHTLPIPRWIILGSHILASAVVMMVTQLVILVIGLLLGFDLNATIPQFLSYVVLSLGFAFAITLLAVPFSLKAKSWEGAGGFSYILLMLLFVSSAFVPTNSMPSVVQVFADYQPMTSIVETARAFLSNSSVDMQTLLLASGWIIGLIIVCGYVSYKRYNQVF